MTKTKTTKEDRDTFAAELSGSALNSKFRCGKMVLTGFQLSKFHADASLAARLEQDLADAEEEVHGLTVLADGRADAVGVLEKRVAGLDANLGRACAMSTRLAEQRDQAAAAESHQQQRVAQTHLPLSSCFDQYHSGNHPRLPNTLYLCS